MTVSRLARDLRNQWGVNAPFNSAADGPRTAAALAYLGTRWVRQQFSGDNTAAMLAVQSALVSNGYPDPNLKLQLLLNGYIANANTNTLANQETWILNSLLPAVGPNGKSILRAIEGPNEMNNPNVGQGSRGPNDQTDKTDSSNFPNNSAIANANLVDWAQQVSAFRAAHSGLAGVELISGTVVYFYPGTWPPGQLDVSAYTDFPTFHYYAGVTGTTGVPSYPPAASGNLTARYADAQAGLGPGRALVMSEGGASTEAGTGGYSQRGAARYHLLAMMDFFALGGRRSLTYNLFNNDVSTQANTTTFNEDNFGLFWPDGTPKPGAICLHNMQNLLSLGLDANNAANLADTASFTPAYDPSGLVVSGLTDAGTSGSCMVLPKSDGSTMIAVWNEPPIDTGGAATSPAGNSVSVNLGSSSVWRVYDPTGGGGAVDFTAAASVTPIASGSGSVVPLTLHGSPLLIELPAAAAPPYVPPPTPPAGPRRVIRDTLGRRVLLGACGWSVGP